jgi:hypothetical protein
LLLHTSHLQFMLLLLKTLQCLMSLIHEHLLQRSMMRCCKCPTHMFLMPHEIEFLLHLQLSHTLFLKHLLTSTSFMIISQGIDRLSRFLNMRDLILQRFEVV